MYSDTDDPDELMRYVKEEASLGAFVWLPGSARQKMSRAINSGTTVLLVGGGGILTRRCLFGISL